MTCIIGFVDKKNDCVWMGADSLGSNGYTKSVNTQPKVFHHDVFKNVVMGSTTTFRHIDLLKYSENLFPTLLLFSREIFPVKVKQIEALIFSLGQKINFLKFKMIIQFLCRIVTLRRSAADEMLQLGV